MDYPRHRKVWSGKLTKHRTSLKWRNPRPWNKCRLPVRIFWDEVPVTDFLVPTVRSRKQSRQKTNWWKSLITSSLGQAMENSHTLLFIHKSTLTINGERSPKRTSSFSTCEDGVSKYRNYTVTETHHPRFGVTTSSNRVIRTPLPQKHRRTFF